MTQQSARRAALEGQLRELVARSLESGHDRLPPERQLATELGTSRGTIRSLLQALAEEGLLQALPQSGWVVTGRTISEPNNSLIGFTEMGKLFGYTPESDVLESTTRLAYDSEGYRLRLRPRSRVWVLKRLRRLDGTPVSLEEVILPLELAGSLSERDMTNRSLLEDLAEIGVHVTRTDVSIEAQIAAVDVAHFLELHKGAAVLRQVETAFNEFGREVFLGSASYRSDSYRFRTSLTRRSKPPRLG